MTNHIVNYLQLGWRIVPCAYASKTPLIKDWANRASNDRDQIQAWQKEWPRANWAVLTGSKSGIIVLDLESESALDWMNATYGRLLAPRARSGKGWHIHTRYPSDALLRGKETLVGPNGEMIELRGDKQLALLPPSRHPTVATNYEWLPGYEPWALSIPEAPAWVVDAMRKPPEPERKPYVATTEPVGDRFVAAALKYELQILANASNGERNHALNKCAWNLFRFAEADHRAIAQELAAGALALGLTEHETKRTIESAAKARRIHI